jgi:adenylate cyclase
MTRLTGTLRMLQGQRSLAIRLSQSRLFRKYVGVFALFVSLILIANGLVEAMFVYREQTVLLRRIQVEQADAAAAKIMQFVADIERQLDWTVQLPWDAGSLEQRQLDLYRVMRQTPAITQLTLVGPDGRERLRISNLKQDVINSLADLSADLAFLEAAARKVYRGKVEFRQQSVPYITIARSGAQKSAGVIIADVNLRFMWDVVLGIKVGETGRTIVVDQTGRLIAAPDISMVLRNTDLSTLSHIEAAKAMSGRDGAVRSFLATNVEGEDVLSTFAPINPLGWKLFVELPTREAHAPIYAALMRSAVVLGVGLIGSLFAALFLAHRMVIPIRALQEGATRIGAGDAGYKVDVRTGDELESLANQFNRMSSDLRDSKAREDRVARLRRFLSPQLAQVIESTGGEKLLESQRREITVLFCDMRGYSSFTEAATPEEVTQMLAEYHTVLGILIRQYEATLERFTGDGLMAFFNAPLPCPDPAWRAVHMAVDMQAVLRQLSRKWRDLGYQVGFGIGIAHGEATTGRIGFEGRFDYAAIGSCVNLASRLCGDARDGQILVDDTVKGMVAPSIRWESLGPISLKGFRNPVAAYNVLGVRTEGPQKSTEIALDGT